ncbi:MAG: hypothetical protein HYR84_08275 [Planctomycetes bacterium]|nr:hypothetical protein [Planctomycetota bacterium]
MPRSIDDLEGKAVRFWPTFLTEREQRTSVLPKLIESQEKFIGILYVADATPTAWKEVLAATAEMPANLFLKHLIVLSDVGGEKLKRFRTSVSRFFPDAVMHFRWKGTDTTYKFLSIDSTRGWTNNELQIDGAGCAKPAELDPAIEDVAMLLIHGGTSTDPGLPDVLTEKCVIGTLIGRKKELDSFVRQRYIHVSRITGGATANSMGQLCQQYVLERLKSALPEWDFSRKTIPGITQNEGRTDMSFDIVAQAPSGKCCAIEVSFQVTTNSTIERKAGQAESRRRLLKRKGHKIAYVIDGAGNFERRSALATICAHSDFVATFRDDELDSLVRFLRSLD